MKLFKIDNNLSVICESKPTRTAFKHEATLMRSSNDLLRVKICYQNRTWEKYTFESVLNKLNDKATDQKMITEEEAAKFNKQIQGQFMEEDAQEFNDKLKTIGAIASLGKIITQGDKKESNTWTEGILKAGLPGLSLPEDWKELTEEEKETRLKNVIDQFNL